MLFAGAVSGKMRVANFESPHQFLDGVNHALARGFDPEAGLVLAVSCVGRRLALGVSVFKETEPLRELVPKEISMIGFYGYGEIGFCPRDGRSNFLNHSFTVLSLREA